MLGGAGHLFFFVPRILQKLSHANSRIWLKWDDPRVSSSTETPSRKQLLSKLHFHYSDLGGVQRSQARKSTLFWRASTGLHWFKKTDYWNTIQWNEAIYNKSQKKRVKTITFFQSEKTGKVKIFIRIPPNYFIYNTVSNETSQMILQAPHISPSTSTTISK